MNYKLICLFLLSFTLSSCLGTKQANKTVDLPTLSWLLGKWNRLNTKPGQTAYEAWEKASATQWKGTGVSMKNGTKSFEEQLQLLKKEDGLFYAALVPENGQWVFFKITQHSKNHFVCENPEHDFPKKITYTLKENGQLEAIVSGNGKEMKFEFEKEN